MSDHWARPSPKASALSPDRERGFHCWNCRALISERAAREALGLPARDREADARRERAARAAEELRERAALARAIRRRFQIAPGELLTEDQAALVLERKPSTLANWRSRKPPLLPVRRDARYAVEDLVDFMRSTNFHD